jgi:hypothetical protein
MRGDRIDGGALLAALGAAILLVSLFLDWYEPDLSSWTVFELVDITLAAIALAALVSVGEALLGRPTSVVGERALRLLAIGALIIVVASLIDPPPAASESDPEVGAWLALVGVVLLAAGSFLRDVRLSVVVTPREHAETRADPGAETRPFDPGRRS